MKRHAIVALLAFTGLLAGCDFKPGQVGQLPPIETYFSPKGGVTEAVVHEIDAAQRTIFVQAYSFTSIPIAEALANAHKRGVLVRCIFDKSQKQEKYTHIDFIAHEGIPTQIDSKHEIAHNKIMIIDGATVITGSFNFTKQAETSNAENLLIIRDQQIAARYLENWHDHEAHSEQYDGRGMADNSVNEQRGTRSASRQKSGNW